MNSPVLLAAAVTSLLFGALVLGSLTYNPRLWKQDFPSAVRQEMAPLSRRERIERVLLAGLLGAVVIGIPLLSVITVKSGQGEVTFFEGFLHIWLVFMAVNIVDLIVIDWLIGIWWQPAFLLTPEIEPLLQHNTYRFHAVEHLKGALFLSGLALVLGGLLSLEAIV